MKEKQNELQENVLNPKSLERYLRRKGENHNHYKYYSTIDRISGIIENKTLFLTRGDEWNDTNDRKNLNPKSSRHTRFARCFSFSQEESIAAWMLYGGIQKKGAMVDFTKKAVRNILTVDEIEVGFFEKDKFISVYALNKDQFEIYMTDIVYFSKRGNGYTISRSDEIAQGVSENIIESMKDCAKSYPWKYENETRLIVSISNKAIDERCTAVRIVLQGLDIGKTIERVYVSPVFQGDKMGIFNPSLMTGSVEWDLCKGCEGSNTSGK